MSNKNFRVKNGLDVEGSIQATTVNANLIGNVTGTVSSLSNQTTTSLTEGTNKYYTDTRVGSYLNSIGYATQSDVGTAIANLAASAPATLEDTVIP